MDVIDVEVKELAIGVFGSENKADQWLVSDKKMFDGKSPLLFSSTEAGKLKVIEELNKIKEGYFL
ncbi:MbcA/ParS/Xre antitoxin family protein [Dasania marina]|uniref:MbcA/ParS/Xre antitoxin family protein n=1 Tax=Dasania marina TaxID=471499 RepID=UPI0003654641|nr:MbcA/ParS/Xre antitoxin family protein [Dasania marina]